LASKNNILTAKKAISWAQFKTVVETAGTVLLFN
jgi:hypothetical protein